jgi:hypothetical protein
MSFMLDTSLSVAAIESFIEFVRRILKRLKIGFDGREIYVALKDEERPKGSMTNESRRLISQKQICLRVCVQSRT